MKPVLLAPVVQWVATLVAGQKLGGGHATDKHAQENTWQ